MPGRPDLPIVDHHCHLSPNGEGVRAAERFEQAGGSHLFLATQQYGPKTPSSVEEYRAQFEETERLARRIEAETSVVVYLVVAPYPVDLLRAAEELGVAGALDLHRGALELAGRWVEEDRAVALGEVGRPHFSVEPALAEAAETAFRYALEVARDAGCPAVVHSEDLTPEGYRSLAKLAAQASFPVGRLVKHYAREAISPDQRAGVVPSIVARRETVRAALAFDGPWFLETDFLDDPRRPGAVLDLATVPRRASAILSESPESYERLAIPFVESVTQVYGFTPSRKERVG